MRRADSGPVRTPCSRRRTRENPCSKKEERENILTKIDTTKTTLFRTRHGLDNFLSFDSISFDKKRPTRLETLLFRKFIHTLGSFKNTIDIYIYTSLEHLFFVLFIRDEKIEYRQQHKFLDYFPDHLQYTYLPMMFEPRTANTVDRSLEHGAPFRE